MSWDSHKNKCHTSGLLQNFVAAFLASALGQSKKQLSYLFWFIAQFSNSSELGQSQKQMSYLWFIAQFCSGSELGQS